LRRRADLSQRELAARSGVPPATVGSVECGGSRNPSFRTVERLVAATGARLAIVDVDGSEPVRPPHDGLRDRAGRHFPAHLDVRQVTWRGAGWVGGFGYVRDRRFRDQLRRRAADESRDGPTYEVRRLGSGDTATLVAIRSDARDLDLAGREAVDRPPISDEGALRYLRDPSLRHWVAAERRSERIIGHLVARLHDHHAGNPVMIVVDIGIRPEHRHGLVGITLTAALSDEAAASGVDRIVAITDNREAASYLRRLGFRRGSRRTPQLTLPWR
jgi:transcriptional regulator with XRE-family HTH domain/ribosomal protein S18 acetylase RimI-like enzyme